jgi:hypothetical protein
MKHIGTLTLLLSILFTIPFCVQAADVNKASVSPLQKKNEALRTPIKKSTSVIPAKNDTLIILARLVEIPGKFPPNDLYNYVYIMKYRVLKVVKGTYTAGEILVGQYNPRIPRKQLHDKMAANVLGNVTAFEVNAKHKLYLIRHIDQVWKDAVEDDYTDSDMDKYFAVKTDKVQ